MPFIYDKASGLFVSSSGSSVRALNVDKRDRTAVIVQNYTGHNADVNDLLVTFHMLFSCSDEVICHNFGTGREKWRLLKEVGQPIAKLSFLGDTLVVCMADCSVAMINIRRGTLLYYVELKGERVGGLPFIGIDEFNRMAYVQGNRCVNGWSLAVGRRVFNTDLVVGQVSIMSCPWNGFCRLATCCGLASWMCADLLKHALIHLQARVRWCWRRCSACVQSSNG